MNRRIWAWLILLSASALILSLSWVSVEAEENTARVIVASATSSSEDSKPVADLIDPGKEGFWKPCSRDSGECEGLFFQFRTPVLVDWVEVRVKGFDKGWIAWPQVEFFLDGRATVNYKAGLSKEAALEYRVEASRTRNGDTVFRLGAVGRTTPDKPQGLRVRVKSVFIKSLPSAALTVRFFRDGVSGSLPVETPAFVQAEAAATSTLAPENAYHVRNLLDSRPEFAWATDGKKTSGVGEGFTITMVEPQTIGGIILWNGYQRSETHYQANARPSRMSVRVDDREPFSLAVKDVYGDQYIPFPETFENVSRLVIAVEGVYAGTRYKDMVISELKLMGGNGRIVAPAVTPLNVRPTNQVADRLIDITWGSYMHELAEEFCGHYARVRLRMRSNGSFVAYRNSIVMEGNWEEIPNGIKLFGKKYGTDPYDSLYLQAVKEKTTVQIFMAEVAVVDVANVPFESVRKALQTILADRMHGLKLEGRTEPINWCTGLDSDKWGSIYGKSQEELLRAAYKLAVRSKALLVVSPLFTELMRPADEIHECYGP